MKAGSIRKALWVVDLALVVFLVALAANVLAKPAAKVVKPDVSAATAPAPAGKNRLTDEELKLITESGVIVPAPASPLSPVAITKPEPETNSGIGDGLGFTLVGTFVGGGMPAAIFTDSSGAEILKVIGDTIGNARITGIWEDRVMLEKAGLTGYVWLVKPKPGVNVPSAPQVASAAPVNTSPAPDPQAAEGDQPAEGGESDMPSPDQTVMSVKVYRDYLQNIGLYINQLSILSHQGPDNNLDGLLLAKVPKDSEAYKRGFREGDIVTSIQGQPITNVQQAQQIAWDILKNEDYVVDVLVQRAGQEEVLTYEIWPE